MLVADNHPEVEVTMPDGTAVNVDKGIARLLQAAWKRGIRTRFSCEGDRKAPTTRREFAELLSNGRIIAVGPASDVIPQSGSAYIMFDDLASASVFADLAWKRNQVWEASKPSARSDLRIVVSFPARDIPKIERALRQTRGGKRRGRSHSLTRAGKARQWAPAALSKTPRKAATKPGSSPSRSASTSARTRAPARSPIRTRR